MNTLILTINNKEKSIKKIIISICETLSSYTKEIFIIFDGCTDNSFEEVNKIINIYYSKFNFSIFHTDDIWETKANNVGLKKANTKFVTIVQDDMLFTEKNWDAKLISCLDREPNIFSVSGRTGLDLFFVNNLHIGKNFIGREYPFGSNTFFGKFIAKILRIFNLYHLINLKKSPSERLLVNRGPWLIRHKHIKELNFLDEIYAPLDLDDADLCCRAYNKFSMKSLVFPIKFKEINGSKKNNSNSFSVFKKAFKKNSLILKNRFSDLQDI